MEFSLPEFPSAPGAQAAFVASAIAILPGLLLLLFPTAAGRLFGLQSGQTRTGAIGELRAFGGFLAGLAMATLMFDQPVLYTALGVAFAIAAFGRIVSLMSDRAATVFNVLLLIIQIVLAGASLYYFFDVFTPGMQFTVPQELNARLVFYTYVGVVVVGALLILAPRIVCKIAGLEGMSDTGYTSVRSAGGFAIGAAGVAMTAPQPMMDFGMAAALAVGVVGRVTALVFNRGNYIHAIAALALQMAGTAIVASAVMAMM